MNSKSETSEEPKDRTKWIWLGVLALIGVLVVVLWVANRQTADVTRVRPKHILVKFAKDDPVARARALESITDLRRRIENGERFESLAKEFSDDPTSAPRGGDLGYYPRNSFDPAFEQYVWHAEVGKLSDIVQSGYGFHLIVVVDRHISSTDQYEMDIEKKASAEKEASAPPAK